MHRFNKAQHNMRYKLVFVVLLIVFYSHECAFVINVLHIILSLNVFSMSISARRVVSLGQIKLFIYRKYTNEHP